MEIKSVSDFRKAILIGPYAWPGGYPLYFICDDGGALHYHCAKIERRAIVDSIGHNIRDGWAVVALDINWEDTELTCDHCHEPIASAYGEMAR